MEILIHTLGTLGILAGVASFQCKQHKHILGLRTANELLFALQYLLLGAYTGMAMNVIGSVRNLIFAGQVAKNKSTWKMTGLFCGIFLLFGILTWQGPKSILIIGAKLLSTLAYGNKNTTVVRGIVLVTSTGWLLYNLTVSSFTGVLCEALHILSILTGILRLDILPILHRKTK